MKRRVRVASAQKLTEGQIQAVDVGGLPVAIARSGGKLYAFANKCSHEEFPLEDGWVDQQQVECPFHGSVFNLETGEPINPPAVTPIAVYAAELDGDDVVVTIDT
jgi:3-phenylpropionate/trans-cinnamate dioxygenase ferredoxin subunit